MFKDLIHYRFEHGTKSPYNEILNDWALDKTRQHEKLCDVQATYLMQINHLKQALKNIADPIYPQLKGIEKATVKEIQEYAKNALKTYEDSH